MLILPNQADLLIFLQLVSYQTKWIKVLTCLNIKYYYQQRTASISPMIQPLYSIKRNNRIKTTLPEFQKSYNRERYQHNEELVEVKNRANRVFSIAKSTKNENKSAIDVKSHHLLRKKQLLLRSFQSLAPQFVFHLTNKANNEELISQLLIQRGNWTKNETNSLKEVNFVWGNVSNLQKSRLSGKQVHSRVKGSTQITQKGNLYENVVNYCEKRNLDLAFLPITFYLKRQGPPHLLKQNAKEFVQFFKYVQTHTNLINTWIMKPTNMNQGRDIHLFSSLENLGNLLKGRRLTTLAQNYARQEDPQKFISFLEDHVKTNRSLILQKYVQNPYLLKGHKFDIRIWVLLDHLRNFYVFEEGYLRFSSEPYKLNSATITDSFMHLTNHSLQKYSPNYSQSHSIQPISTLKEDLKQKGKTENYQRILAKINEIITITMKAGFRGQRKPTQKSFQLFGYDFLIDREQNVRLIEVNCNPAITQDNPLLQQLIPKMLNDMFKLTIDKLFKTRSSKSYGVPRLNHTNAWIFLGSLAENEQN